MNHSVNQANEKVKKAQGLLARIRNNNSGNFAIMAGAILPVICVSGLYGVDAYYRVMKTKKFNEYVVNACHRAVKPTRTQLREDKDRKATAQALAEGSFPKNQFDNIKVTTTAGWLTGTVKASATFKPILKLIDNKDVSVNAEYSCEGIPPYPHDGEELLNTQFTNEQGKEVTLEQSYIPPSQAEKTLVPNCFDIYNGVDLIKWDGSHGWTKERSVNKEPDKPGQIEVQFWGQHETAGWSGCFSSGDKVIGYPPLPKDAPSVYGIELDAYYNNEIWKDIELHPGHYKMSVWYFPRGRVPSQKWIDKYPKEAQFPYWDDITNGIGFYLEGKNGDDPVPKTPVICVNGKKDDGWIKKTYSFRVDKYNVYTISAKGEQMNDSVGGIFNSLEITYVDDLNAKNKFPKEYVLGKSEFSNFKNCTDYLDYQVYNQAGG